MRKYFAVLAGLLTGAVDGQAQGGALGSLGQLVAGGGWNTRMVVVNVGAAPVAANLKFYDPTGAAMALPVATVGSGTIVVTSSVNENLAGKSLTMLDTVTTNVDPSQVGWSQLSGDTTTNAFDIFSNSALGWHGTVPLETRNAASYFLPFDNTGSLGTGAIASNVVAFPASVPVVIRDDLGTQIGTAMINLASQGHTSFTLSTQYPTIAGKRGTIEFQTPAGGRINVLGLRINGTGLTTIPVLADVDTSGGAFANVSYNGGFTSVFHLVNTGMSSASFTLSFFDNSGSPLSVPLQLPQSSTTTTTSALTTTLAAGAMLVVQTQANDMAANIAGSAQLTTTGNISGLEVYRWNTVGQEVWVPLETRTNIGFTLVFDNTNGGSSAFTLSNVTGSAAGATARIYDDTGALLQTATINLPAWGHTSFGVTNIYPVTSGKRGTVEVIPPAGGQIAAWGLQVYPNGTLTTIPPLGPAAVANTVLRDPSGGMRLGAYASVALSLSGGVFASDPAVAEDSGGNVFVAARDASNSIWTNVFNPGTSTWAGWQLGGGTTVGVPSIAVAPNGTAWIGARTSFGSYWLVSYTNGVGYGTWLPLGGAFSTDPVITACGDGSFYVVGKDSFTAVWSGHYIPGPGFQGWVLGGGAVSGKASLTCGNDNAAYLVARDSFNSSWVARIAGNTWTGWFNGGAQTSVDPKIAALGGSEALVILDAGGAVWRNTFSEGTGNGWQTWTNVGGGFADVSPAGVGGELFFIGRSLGNDLWWWSQASNLFTGIGNNGVAVGALAAAPK